MIDKTKDSIFLKKDEKNNVTPIGDFDYFQPEWICMKDIQSEPQSWFWQDFIALDMLTLFAGYGAMGKSLLMLYLIAKTSSGEKFSAGGTLHQLKKGSVILLSAEDDIQQQIKPKLIAAGADCAKIHFIVTQICSTSKIKRYVDLDKCLNVIEEKLEELKDVSLIVVDPITYFLGDVKDISTEVANFLLSLTNLAKKHNIAFCLNKHLRKMVSGSKGIINAANEVAGSGAWVNTPRKCWLITNHPEEKGVKVITNMKDNLTMGSDDCLAYKIVAATIHDNGVNISTTQIEWLDKLVTISATEAVDKETYEKSKLQQAIDFIMNHLEKNGQSVVVHIRDLAVQKGIKKETFRRATVAFEQAHEDILVISKGIRGAKIYSLKD